MRQFVKTPSVGPKLGDQDTPHEIIPSSAARNQVTLGMSLPLKFQLPWLKGKMGEGGASGAPFKAGWPFI